VQAGVRIAGISIRRQDILIEIASGNAAATLQLDLRDPEGGDGARMSRSFVLRVEPEPAPEPVAEAVARVAASIVLNDDGEIEGLS